MSKWTKIIKGDKSTYPEKNGIYLCRFDTTKDSYCLSQFVNGEFEQHIISNVVSGEVMDEDAYDVISWCEIPTDEKSVINSNEFSLTEEFYKNGLSVFCNPCEKHSGEDTPTPEVFWEKYSHRCLICLVDENEELKLRKGNGDCMKKPTRTDCIKTDVCKYPDDGMCPMECGYYQPRGIMSSCDGCDHLDRGVCVLGTKHCIRRAEDYYENL